MKLFTIAFLGIAPVFASATMITFDEFGTQPALFDNASPENDTYLPQGVRFRGPGGSTEIGGMMLNDSTFTVKAHSGNNFLAMLSSFNPEQLTFTTPQNAVSIYAASVDTHAGTFVMAAFDANGNQIDSDTLTLARGVWGQLSVTAPSISKVTLTETSGVFTFVYDDLNFSPVPEPASFAVLAVGALALMRRRK
ncbi:MAG: PEP-CTERM sorting domain-containing protein [Armatimonadetes bacterium]|nr:PEP-CTERM sorting domain-containing protein [Armatimonadota bacterium]